MSTRLSLKTKITILVVTVIGLTSGFLGQFVITTLSNLLTDAAGRGAVTAATAIAGSVEPEVLETGLASLNTSKVQHRMEDLVGQGHLVGASIMRVEQNRVTYVASAGQTFVTEHHAPGTSFDPADKRSTMLHWKQEAGRSLWVFEDAPEHLYMAGWSPIFDSRHQIGLALVFVDVTAINSALSTLIVAVAVTCLTLVLLSGVVAYKFGAGFEKSAVTDGLMGIYNHKYLKQRLEQEVAKAARYGQQTSLVLFDIDFFKRVNDTYGHATGDLVLKSLAKWVTETARNTDVVARYGGEEIAVILPHTGLAGAQEFAERLRLKISNQVVHDPGEDAKFRVTVSVGVAQWEKGLSMMDLIKRADAALYHSKNMGRNRVTIFQEEILPGESPVGAPAAQGKR